MEQEYEFDMHRERETVYSCIFNESFCDLECIIDQQLQLDYIGLYVLKNEDVFYPLIENAILTGGIDTEVAVNEINEKLAKYNDGCYHYGFPMYRHKILIIVITKKEPDDLKLKLKIRVNHFDKNLVHIKNWNIVVDQINKNQLVLT